MSSIFLRNFTKGALKKNVLVQQKKQFSINLINLNTNKGKFEAKELDNDETEFNYDNDFALPEDEDSTDNEFWWNLAEQMKIKSEYEQTKN